jgi:glycosyltransferase involved in cell wall biosynthesis
MHIALVGPIAGADVRDFLFDETQAVCQGYVGAPLTGIIIGELLRLGHRVTAITTDSTLSLAGGAVRREGKDFSFIVCPARPRAWAFNGQYLGRVVDFFATERKAISDVLASEGPDIVHAHWSYEFALAALNQPAPHLITCHDAPAVVLRLTRSPYRALRYLMARRVFRKGREFTTVSDYMAAALASPLGHLPQVIPNPVAAHVLALGRDRKASASRRIAMVCNGWGRLKNAKPALRAFAQWRLSEPSAELHLFGADFGAGEQAQRWAQGEGIAGGMNFHGRLPHRDLVKALNQTDALIHPALEESFGVVLAEAMALGLPIVAGLKSGAVPWVMGADANGQSGAGLLTDVRSPRALTQALIELFDDHYEAKSACGRQMANDRYAPLAVTQAYLKRYQSILQAPQPSQLSLVTQEMAD